MRALLPHQGIYVCMHGLTDGMCLDEQVCLGGGPPGQ